MIQVSPPNTETRSTTYRPKNIRVEAFQVQYYNAKDCRNWPKWLTFDRIRGVSPASDREDKEFGYILWLNRDFEKSIPITRGQWLVNFNSQIRVMSDQQFSEWFEVDK